MSTLIVLLPPRDPAVPSQEWQLPEMPFILLDKTGRKERAGRAALAFLPRASTTVLIVAARDLLMLAAPLPPVKGPRLKQALPNVVEDFLIQDAQTCHIALDPQPLADGKRMLAVIDRGWFRFIVEAFNAAGHRSLRAVPVTRCLPAAALPASSEEPVLEQAEAEALAQTAGAPNAETPPSVPAPLVAAVLGTVAQTAPAILADAVLAATPEPAFVDAAEPRVELALARGEHGEGLAVPLSALGSTLAALAGEAPVTAYELAGLPGGEPTLAGEAMPAHGVHVGVAPLSFETLAHNALESRFDLCQFEFESRPWRLDRATLRRLRLPIALACAALLAAVIGANVQWMMLVREHDALNAQMTELLLNAFPKTTVVLDPASQMTTQLEHLRVAAGEMSPGDYLSLAARFEHSLGGVPVNGIASLDYHDRRLEVAFKPGVKPDPAFTQRLAQNGLGGEIDTNTGKWVIRNGGGQ
ncbi:type II secretion system protein GspL [Trinickia dabaoshanensis]|uniref:Type II secretion system protein GspL n=1 Tax=Trinickia dabaoshanensis TaxID=564714 RepID=A0A2N7VZV1_9BURK|nr:type II secretion system protein GspL [Trinickia dabaoshanensis]PMS22699.1 type II secretion system protein GspL [Trinickia dabaoshanensis]